MELPGCPLSSESTKLPGRPKLLADQNATSSKNGLDEGPFGSCKGLNFGAFGAMLASPCQDQISRPIGFAGLQIIGELQKIRGRLESTDMIGA